MLRSACCFALLVPLAAWVGCRPPEKPAPAAAPPAEVVVSRPLLEEVSDAIESTGTTAPLAAVEIRARVSGFLERMLVAPRDVVEPNQPLFAIDRRPFELRLQTAQADRDARLAQLSKAEFDANKVTELHQRGVASLDELTKETSNRDMLRAAAAAAEAVAAEAALQLEWSTVVAPTRGRISRNLIDAGNIVSADTTVLASVVDDSQVYVYFNASERDILELRERTRRERAADGQPPEPNVDLRKLHHPVFLGLMTEAGFPHEGVLDYAAPSVDAATGTQQIRAVFPNENGLLLAGLFVRVRVPIGKPRPALLVTERALGSDQGQRYVLTVNAQNVVEQRPVKIAALSNGLRVIAEGLAADDRVIVTGMQRVRPGLTVKPVDGPMPVGPVATTRPASAAQPSQR
jgi:RND family efflux transporter MFP subunit